MTPPESPASTTPIESLTPILQVERIEPSLPFFASLGFQKTVEVPHGDRLGFVILQLRGMEVMLQTVESIAADVPAMAVSPPPPSTLFLQVSDLERVHAALVDAELVLGPRDTFYGMREVFVREPGGNMIGLAQRIAT